MLVYFYMGVTLKFLPGVKSSQVSTLTTKLRLLTTPKESMVCSATLTLLDLHLRDNNNFCCLKNWLLFPHMLINSNLNSLKKSSVMSLVLLFKGGALLHLCHYSSYRCFFCVCMSINTVLPLEVSVEHQTADINRHGDHWQGYLFGFFVMVP